MKEPAAQQNGTEQAKTKKNVIGILSFVFGSLPWLYFLAYYLLISHWLSESEIRIDAELPFCFGGICLLVFSILGLIFGIIGISKKYEKKVFAILGIILSSLGMLGTAFLLLTFFG